MYESHFGLSGPPFQLNPDPEFYFESRGHANALSYLKFGVFQGEGFIVVTGEVGAGKTTLVRTLLSVLNREQVVAAQLVSTQLEAGDLLRAIVAAFGIAPQGTSKAELISTLESFLTALAAKGRRALLVVDEAQNLSLQAIEELRMLSNFQLGNRALLQSFLVGQPELRTMLQSQSMLQFRQRVIASCHLGPMELVETRAYVEHRLTKAGWSGRPAIDDVAFAQIHRWSGGVPRRINMLCNRVLLSCFLAGEERITAELVGRVAQELLREVGETAAAPMSSHALPAADPHGVPIGAAHEQAEDVGDDTAGDDEADEADQADGDARLRQQWRQALPSELPHPILVLVDTPLWRLKAGALAHHAAGQGKLPGVVVVSLIPANEAALWTDSRPDLPAPIHELRLTLPPGGFAAMAVRVLASVEALLEESKPSLVLSCGSSDAQLAAALLCVKKGIRLARADAGLRRTDAQSLVSMNGRILDGMADLLFTSRLTAHYSLHREGIAAERCFNAGPLIADMLQLALPHLPDAASVVAASGVSRDVLRQPGGFALATVSLGGDGVDELHAGTVVGILRAMSATLPVVWLVDESTAAVIGRQRLDVQLRQAAGSVVMLPRVSYPQSIGLLVEAKALVAGNQQWLIEEALALGRPPVTLGDSAEAAGADDAGNGFAGLDKNRALRRLTEALAAAQGTDMPSLAGTAVSQRMIDQLRQLIPKQRRSRLVAVV